MSAPPPAPASGLAGRLVDWMAANRPALDELMAQEGSRAIHEEFILTEGGTLPDRSARIARARTASARAWMRHLAQAVAAELPGAPPADFGRRVAAWSRAAEGRRREVEREAVEAWGAVAQGPEMTAARESAPELDAVRVQEAAAVWAHVRTTAEALEATLTASPER